MKLQAIKAKLTQILTNLSAVKTDKAVINYDGDELKEGVAVWTTDEDGNQIALEDGEYTTEDNKVITVADGKVSSIEEKKEEEEKPEEEETKEEELTKEQEFAQKKEEFSVSYGEKEWAVNKAFGENEINCWVFECADDYAIVEEYDENYDFVGFFRYSISVDENANVTIDKDSRVEVVQKWVEKDEKKEEVAEEEKPQEEETKEEIEKSEEFTNTISKLVNAVESISERLSKIEKMSAGKPIEIEVENSKQTKKTGDEKIDRFLSRYGK